MADLDKLIDFYENSGEEELRIQPGGAHFLEFTTAMELLRKYLPGDGRVLDSCAGTGVYAFALAEEGFRVTAGDIVPYNVEIMQDKQRNNGVLADIYHGDALDLSRFGDETFDAVLCMGALYHLHRPGDRERAVRESMRVLKPDGVFAATYMNRYAVILNNAAGSLDNIDEIMEFAKEGKEGVFYASTPAETEAMMARFGAKKICHAALDGVVNFLHATTGLLNDAGAARWGEFHRAVCEEPSLLGYSYHNLYIARKM